jgi:hypothetical protein
MAGICTHQHGCPNQLTFCHVLQPDVWNASWRPSALARCSRHAAGMIHGELIDPARSGICADTAAVLNDW